MAKNLFILSARAGARLTITKSPVSDSRSNRSVSLSPLGERTGVRGFQHRTNALASSALEWELWRAIAGRVTSFAFMRSTLW